MLRWHSSCYEHCMKIPPTLTSRSTLQVAWAGCSDPPPSLPPRPFAFPSALPGDHFFVIAFIFIIIMNNTTICVISCEWDLPWKPSHRCGQTLIKPSEFPGKKKLIKHVTWINDLDNVIVCYSHQSLPLCRDSLCQGGVHPCQKEHIWLYWTSPSWFSDKSCISKFTNSKYHMLTQMISVWYS